MVNTVLCYVEREGCYLLLHRIKKQQDINAGKWIGVGGKLEAGESPEDALLREVREETGLTLTRWKRRGLVTFVTNDTTEYMHVFTADGFEGTLTDTCDEGVLRWVPKGELDTLPMWEGDREFLPLLTEDRPYFSLKLVYDGDRLIQACHQ